MLAQALLQGEDLSASKVAAVFSMSVRSLSRHLAQEQTSLSRLTAQVRVERAHWLLSNDNLPLVKIATLTGFASQSAFTRAFKSHYGKTPGELRQSFKYGYGQGSVLKNHEK